jgi:hypothetical protein
MIHARPVLAQGRHGSRAEFSDPSMSPRPRLPLSAMGSCNLDILHARSENVVVIPGHGFF